MKNDGPDTVDASSRRGRAFEFDLIAFGILQIDRRPLTFRPIAAFHRSGLDAMACEMRTDRRGVERLNPQTKMIHVARLHCRRRTAGPAQRPRDIDEIDQGTTGAQLGQADLLLAALDPATQRIAVETLEPDWIARTNDDVIEAEQDEGSRRFRAHGDHPAAAAAAGQTGLRCRSFEPARRGSRAVMIPIP